MNNTDFERNLVSVVIPVHNGEKKLRRTIDRIIKQTYKNFEIILVENNSSDRSWDLCLSLSKTDDRIIAYQSFEKGTSLARKKGVEIARGKYVVFSDQDDRFYSKNSLYTMVKAISEDKTQICQFNVCKKIGIFSRKLGNVSERRIMSAETVYKEEIGGVFGVQKNSVFTQTVWSKIYDAEMLKNAVKNINSSLLFSEDMYLNLWAFFDEKTKKISARPDCIYVWNAGVGFSSSPESAMILFQDYEVVKPDLIEVCEKHNIDDEYIWNSNLESLYSFKVLVCNLIGGNIERNEVIKIIEKINNYNYLRQAKKWIACHDTYAKWSELQFMISEYTSDEYYEWCSQNLPRKNFRSILRGILSRFV